MDKNKEPLGIELFFDDESDLDILIDSKEFHDIIFNEVVRSLKVAIESKENKAVIINLTNLKCSLVSDKSNFASLIDNVILYFESKEDYEKCNELVELKNKDLFYYSVDSISSNSDSVFIFKNNTIDSCVLVFDTLEIISCRIKDINKILTRRYTIPAAGWGKQLPSQGLNDKVRRRALHIHRG